MSTNILRRKALAGQEIEEFDEPKRKHNHLRQVTLHEVASSETAGGEETQLDLLLRIGSDAELFHSDTGELFARVPVRGHCEVHPIRERGSGFRRWLTMRYYEETHGVPSANAMKRAMELFTAQADMEGPTHEVFTRCSYHDGAIYVDLGDEKWQAVKITADGWEVVDRTPVYFRRHKGTLAMPKPEHGGSLDELKTFFNVATETDWMMLVAWFIGYFHPKGPYPILDLNGEAGTAKSSATRYARLLVDPNAAPLRDAPKEPRDLVIAAKNGRVLALDNLSAMPQWLSDALCRMATGSGYATRQLYTDDEEALFNARRPIVFNGIEELATRGDLADRCLIVTLEPISGSDRKTEARLDKAWAKAQPRILGALFDVVAGALAEEDNVHVAELPRMADFALWICAAEKALGWKPGAFLAAYEQNRANAIEAELDASSVATAVLKLMRACRVMRTCRVWHGTPEEFYAAVTSAAGDKASSNDWPKNAQRLSSRLTRLAPALRSRGVTIKKSPSNGKRYVDVTMSDSDATVTQQ